MSVSKTQRLVAGLAAIGVTFSIVWAMSDYAYPEPASFLWGQVAKHTAQKSCAPG